MLMQLECGYEINLDTIGALQLHGDKRGPGGRVFIGGFLTLDITPIELEIIRAYHQGKSVDATRKEIEKRMEEARTKAEQDAKQKRQMDLVTSTFCKFCANGPDPKLGLCSCGWAFNGDNLVQDPTGYTPNLSVRATKPFSVAGLPDLDPGTIEFQRKMKELEKGFVSEVKERCHQCKHFTGTACEGCLQFDGDTATLTKFEPKPDCSGAQHEVARGCLTCANMERPICPACDSSKSYPHWQPRA